MAAVLLTEGLLRRHVPSLMKKTLLIVTPLLMLASLWPQSSSEPWLSALLYSWQIIVLAVCARLLRYRDADSLSGAENELINRISVSLLVILPLLLTDFAQLFEAIPIRSGALGILALCWLAIDGSTRAASVRSSMTRLALLILLAALVGMLVAASGAYPTMSFSETVKIIAIVTGGGLLLAIASDALNLPSRNQNTLPHALATGVIDSHESLVARLDEYPLTDGARLIVESDPTDFDIDQLQSAFEQHTIMHRSELDPDAHDIDQQLDALCARYTASCLMTLSSEPLTVLALQTPSLGSTRAAEVDLTLNQRLASQLTPQAAVGITR